MTLQSLPTAYLASLFIFGIVTRAEDRSGPETAPAVSAEQAALERDFELMLTNATLVGHFAAEEPDGHDTPPKAERYSITKVTKLARDRWLFAARMQFGTKDVTVPLIIPVKWAGDTPVISVTDLTVPGVGTYTARVMIYRDHYAGTWSGARHGGTMWGKIEHPAPATASSTKPE